MQAQIATPEKTIFAGPADSISVIGEKGQLQILPRHAGLVTFLYPGPVVIESLQGGSRTFNLSVGGVLRVDGDTVMVLAKRVQ